jgi:hypothetical protein
MSVGMRRRHREGVSDKGLQRLVSEMILGAVKDLAVLRRRGLWWDDPEEVAVSIKAAMDDPEEEAPGRLMNCQGSQMDLSGASRVYLRGLCAVAFGALGMEIAEDDLIKAARRYSDENQYGRRHGRERLERRAAERAAREGRSLEGVCEF